MLNDNIKIVRNFFIMGVSYGSSILIPLFLMPRFTKILGIEKYGIVVLSQLFIGYLNILIEYHFSVMLTKDVSANRYNIEWLNKVFFSVLFTRFFLAVLASLVFFTIVIFYPPFKSNIDIVIFSYSLILGQVLLPNWFLQGVENVSALAIINVLFKGFYVILTLKFVRLANDAYLVNFLLGFTNIVAGIMATIYIYKKYSFSYIVPKWGEVTTHLKMGRLMFLSTFSASIYATVNPFILGLYVAPNIIGEYVIPERLLGIGRSVLGIFFQVTYSHIALISKSGTKKVYTFYKNIYRPFLYFVLFFSILCFVNAEFIVYNLLNIHKHEVVNISRFLLGVPIVVCLNIPYYQRLLISDLQHIANYVLIVGGGISVVLGFLLIPRLGVIGAIIALYTAEVFVTCALYYQAYKNNLLK